MKLSAETLSKIAHLSRLEIDEKETDKILRDMSNMLSFIEKLNEVNTDGVDPLTTMSHEINAMREDVVREDLSRQQALQNAPKKDAEFFKVPKVL